MLCEDEFWTTGDLISMAKTACEIQTPTDELSDHEIKMVVRWIAVLFGAQGDLLANTEAVQLMLFIALSEFPEFYTRYGLAQYN